MKTTSLKMFITALCCCLLAGRATLQAQPLQDLSLQPSLPTYRLELAWHKTRLLIFPSAIRSADRGDKDVLAETLSDAGNILRVKAGQKDLAPSNLQVVTADGKVYAFTVVYNEDAPAFPVDMGRQAPYAPVFFKGVSLNSKQLEDVSRRIAGSFPFLHGGKYKKYGMELSLEGIYIKEGVLFFQLRLRNETHIPYDLSSLRFYIRDKKKAKRTASQEREVEPIFIQRTGITESQKGECIIAAFPKFTIAENKYFFVELMENGGDRNPACRFGQRKLLKARSL